MPTIGSYETLEELGRGGAGVVYRARHRTRGGEVALKVVTLPERGAVRERRRARVLREAHAAARLRHPGIAGVLEVIEELDRVVLAQELVRGRQLRQVLNERGALEPREALLLVERLARAAHHAHARGVLHRDLKPENVIVDDDGRPHVIDFGLAKELDGLAERLTDTGTLVGTPAYLSPEQARGEVHDLDARADVYALGLILYESLSGERPYWSPTFVGLLEKIDAGVTAPPRTPRGESTGAAGEVALKALAHDREGRFATALDLARACAEARLGPWARTRFAARIGFGVAVAAGALALARHAPPGPATGTPPAAAVGTDAPPQALAASPAPDLASRLERALVAAPLVARLLPELETEVERAPERRAALAGVVLREPEDVYARLLPATGDLGQDGLAVVDLAVLVDEEVPTGSAVPGLEARERALARRLEALALDAGRRAGLAASPDELRATVAGSAAVAALARLSPFAPRSLLGMISSLGRAEGVAAGPEELVRLQAALMAFGLDRGAPPRGPGRLPELVRAATAVAAERPRDPAWALGCATVVLESARAAGGESAASLAAAHALPLLERFHAGASTPRGARSPRLRTLRAIERLERAEALAAGVLPAAANARDEALAAIDEALALGHPRRWAVLELGAQRRFQRAGVPGADPARARADLEAALALAREVPRAIDAALGRVAALRAGSAVKQPVAWEDLLLEVGRDAILPSSDAPRGRALVLEAGAQSLLARLVPERAQELRRAAVEACRQSLWHLPDAREARVLLARLLAADGSWREALVELDRALADASPDESAALKGERGAWRARVAEQEAPAPGPGPAAPSPSPAADAALAVADLPPEERTWDGHGWRRTAGGHRHRRTPGGREACEHAWDAARGRWSFERSEPRVADYESIPDVARRRPESGLYDWQGKTWYLHGHVHSGGCAHVLRGDRWVLREPER